MEEVAQEETDQDGGNPWRRYRVYRTVAIYAALFGMGLTHSVLGPNLVSMEILLNTDTKFISVTFIGGAIGGFLGAVTCGLVYSRMNKELLLMVTVVIICLATAAAPWTSSLYYFIAMISIQSFGENILGAACQPYLLNLWEGHSIKRPLMQTMHGLWSAGSTTGPFIIKPFLVDIATGDNLTLPKSFMNGIPPSNGNPFLITSPELISNGTSVSNISQVDENQNTNTKSSVWLSDNISDDLRKEVEVVCFAYVILAGILLALSLLIIIAYFLLGASCRERHISKTNKIQQEKMSTKLSSAYRFRISLLIFMFVFYYFYAWIEGLPGAFLAAFVVKELHWPNKYGSLVTSAYWGSHGLGRFIGIPVSAAMRPRTMLIMDLAITTVGFTTLLLAKLHYMMVWLGTVLAGIGQGTIFPTAILWLEEHTELTGSAASVLQAASSVGHMTGPMLTGFLFNNFSPMWLIYMVLIASLTDIIIFIGAFLFIRTSQKQYPHNELTIEELEMESLAPERSNHNVNM